MALDSDILDVYFQDAEAQVVFNGAPAVPAIKEEYEEPVLEGEHTSNSLAKVIALTCRASQVVGVGEGATAVFETRNFTVRRRMLIHEGQCVHFLLKDAS